MAVHLGFLHQPTAWCLRTRPSLPRRYSQRLAVKLRRLADICEPGNLVDLDEEAFDTGHDGASIEMATHETHLAQVELYRYRGHAQIQMIPDDFQPCWAP